MAQGNRTDSRRNPITIAINLHLQPWGSGLNLFLTMKTVFTVLEQVQV